MAKLNYAAKGKVANQIAAKSYRKDIAAFHAVRLDAVQKER